MMTDYGDECGGLAAEVEQLRAKLAEAHALLEQEVEQRPRSWAAVIVKRMRERLANAARQADRDAGVIADLSAKLEATCDALAGETSQRQELQSALEAAEQRAALAPTRKVVEAIYYLRNRLYKAGHFFDPEQSAALDAWLAALRGAPAPDDLDAADPLRLADVDADPDPA